MIYTLQYHSPIGELLLAEKDGALVGLWMKGQKYFMGALQEGTEQGDDSPVLKQAGQWLDRYFRREKPLISELPLAPVGSVFRREVWDILCQIPYGQVTTTAKSPNKWLPSGAWSGCQPRL